MNQVFAAALALDPAEKLRLIADLWDDLAQDPAAVPVPDWQVEELDARKARLASDPSSGLTWDEVARRIQDRHGR